MASDANNSGIYIFEGPARGQPIPVSGDSVTAFVGPAPRGPVDHAVAIDSPADFQKTFVVPDYLYRLEYAARQLFANGVSNDAVVRVSGSSDSDRTLLRYGRG